MRVKGFTLIELIVIITVLSIMVIYSANKLLNIHVNARNSALKGLEGTLKSGLDMGFAKMAIAGLESKEYLTNHSSQEDAISLPFDECKLDSLIACEFQYGYPRVNYSTLNILVENVGSTGDPRFHWTTFINYTNRNLVITATKNTIEDGTTVKLKNENCYLSYTHPSHINESYNIVLIPCQ